MGSPSPPLAENFDITWNNFEARLSRSFADIYRRQQFLDVTLAAEAEDGSIQALRAHKVCYYKLSLSFSRSKLLSFYKHATLVNG